MQASTVACGLIWNSCRKCGPRILNTTTPRRRILKFIIIHGKKVNETPSFQSRILLLQENSINGSWYFTILGIENEDNRNLASRVNSFLEPSCTNMPQPHMHNTRECECKLKLLQRYQKPCPYKILKSRNLVMLSCSIFLQYAFANTTPGFLLSDFGERWLQAI